MLEKKKKRLTNRREKQWRWGHYFKAVRKRLGLSQAEFSRLMGMKQPWLSKIERGQGEVSVDAISNILVFFGGDRIERTLRRLVKDYLKMR